tara:strand:+ start:6153 stop:6701 length:549 start_codon:yes stop_codon:yes gene_type:complete
MTILSESLNYLDMENQVVPLVSVDEYAAKMGEDKDIVTVTFTVKSKLVAEDLVTWFERGYDFILDASISDGELSPNKWLVFVEMERRSWVARRVISLIKDMETLTGLPVEDYTLNIDGDEYPMELEVMKQKIILNPAKYEIEKEEPINDELNEMRLKAGLDHKESETPKDEYIKSLQASAGI